MPKHLVAVLVYDNLCTFEFGCAVEIFALPRPELNVSWYQFAACSLLRGKVKASGGIIVETSYSINLLDKADTIVIPGWCDLDEPPPENLLRKIRAAYQRGARICTICSGVFIPAAAGILDGKKATTHWRYIEKFKKLYPKIKFETDALYIDTGQIISSAGSAAGLDMFLYLIQKDYGSRIANQVAQRLVIPPHRDGGQAQFISRPLPHYEVSRLSKLMDWVRKNIALSHSIASLAKQAKMSTRTLQRQFVNAAGLSPYEWLVCERIAMVKELLESTKMPLSRIADKVGFNTEESLRKHFRRHVLVSPMAYRRRFSIIKRE